MYQLNPSEYGCVIPLAVAVGVEFPIIWAVLENRQSGQVFADDRFAPRTAIVCHKFGFLTVLNRRDAGLPASEVLDILLRGHELVPKYRLWYNPGDNFLEMLGSHIAAGEVRVRERIRYKLLAVAADLPALSSDWRIRQLERSDVSKLVSFELGFPERFWNSADDFFSQAFAVVAVRGEEVMSICYPAAIGGGSAEIDVATLAQERGRGLGNAVANLFVQEARRRGIEPTWDCFAGNEPSVRLSRRLGFWERCRYSFATFNVL